MDTSNPFRLDLVPKKTTRIKRPEVHWHVELGLAGDMVINFTKRE